MYTLQGHGVHFQVNLRSGHILYEPSPVRHKPVPGFILLYFPNLILISDLLKMTANSNPLPSK